jgi:sulfite reductase alpha subunit-like flavoprotein
MASATYKEDLLVLYGSQKGSAEKAAQDFYLEIEKSLSSDAIEASTGRSDVMVKPKLVELDDFLSSAGVPWTRLVVIVVSSFGDGHAPANARAFRKLCDSWISQYNDNPDKPKILEGVHFALCGLGDSDFPTFMKNPIKVEKALTLAGAHMVGERGIADAFEGVDVQQKLIVEYKKSIWPLLADVVVQEPVPLKRLSEMKGLTKLPPKN